MIPTREQQERMQMLANLAGMQCIWIRDAISMYSAWTFDEPDMKDLEAINYHLHEAINIFYKHIPGKKEWGE